MANEYFVNAADLSLVASMIREKADISEQLVFPAGFVSAIGSISTGGGLNFEVVGGTTQPADPNENTIWVNTDQEITGWSFSDVEPENPQEHIGMVWFTQTGSGARDFNALSENEIRVYMAQAVQRIPGSWVNRETAIYKNGEWLSVWTGILYDHGVIPAGYCGVVSAQSNSSYQAGTMEFQADSWYYSCGSQRSISLRTAEKIDISKYTTLKILHTGSTDGRFGIASAEMAYSGSVAHAGLPNSAAEPASLDISAYRDSGPYYIIVATYKGGSGTNSGRVHKLWLE